MEIQEQKYGAVTALRPRGPLVDREADMLRIRVLDVRTRSLGRLVLDLSSVPFVDSAGLETLLDLTEELSQSGQALKLCGVTDVVREALSLTDISSMFEHFDDVNSGVRSFL